MLVVIWLTIMNSAPFQSKVEDYVADRLVMQIYAFVSHVICEADLAVQYFCRISNIIGNIYLIS